MVPFRKLSLLDDEAPPSSGPPTLRSARFEAAARAPSEAPPSEEGYMPILERSDVIQAVRPRPAPAANEANEVELSEEDLELLFDEDPLFDPGEPDTERTIRIEDFGLEADDHDTEPPPPTLRCPGM